MGIVKKQVYKNTVISYAGMAIAYVNTILLFPFYVSNEQYGLYNLLISLSVLYSLISSLGIPGIIAKYFPFYRTNDGTHNGFLHWTALISAIGAIVLILLLFVFKPLILSAYEVNSPLFLKYFNYLVPLTVFTIVFNFLEVIGRVIYQTIFSSFLRDVLIRIITTVLLLMLANGWIDFNRFIALYIAAWGVISFILLLSLFLTRQFSHKLGPSKFTAIEKKVVLKYGFFTMISVAIYVLLQKVDVIMLSSMAGDAVQGIYSWYFNIAIIISIPAQALSRTTYQIVADSWKSNNVANISQIYSKTSIIQMVFGSLLFIDIIINKENLLAIVHDRMKAEQFDIIILIGLGFLVDITGGLNTYIITTSPRFRIITLFVLLTSLLCIALNYIFIPLYGGIGAAIAYLATMIALNFCTWFYIKLNFDMQPFTSKHLLVILISLLSYGVGTYFWKVHYLYADILIRSVTVAVFYGILTYALRISSDINDKVDSTLKRVRLFQ